VAGGRWSVAGGQWSVTGGWWSVAGGWWLVAGDWLNRKDERGPAPEAQELVGSPVLSLGSGGGKGMSEKGIKNP